MNSVSYIELILRLDFYPFLIDQEVVYLQTTSKRLYKPFLPTYITKCIYNYRDIMNVTNHIFRFKIGVLVDTPEIWESIANNSRIYEIHMHENIDGIKQSLFFSQPALYIKRLMLNTSDNYPITNTQFPNLTHLQVFEYFNMPVDNLPAKLQALDIDTCMYKGVFQGFFDKPIDHLPNTLTQLNLNSRFNQPIDHLPQSLLYLELGDSFNHSVNHLPPSLTFLEFGRRFNHPIDNLPSSLVNLRLGYEFNQPITHLPSTLTYLHLDEEFNHPVDNILPHTLISLFIASETFNYTVNQLPSSLTYLNIWSEEFNQSVDQLPSTLKTLKLSGKFNQLIDHLPAHLENLNLKNRFNRSIKRLPCSLKKLKLSTLFNRPIDLIPDSITELYIKEEFNRTIRHLPNQLTKLVFHTYSEYNKPLESSILPPTLTFLKFGQGYQQLLPLPFPHSLKTLKLHIQYSVGQKQDIPSDVNIILYENDADEYAF